MLICVALLPTVSTEWGECTLYGTRHVEMLLNVSHETVRRWAQEFQSYLSTTSQPGKNRDRRFTTEDVQVLSLVKQLRGEGMSIPEIHTAIKNGQRGEMPTITPDEVRQLATSEHETALSLEVSRLQQLVISLSNQLDTAKEAAAAAEELKIQNATLATKLEATTQNLNNAQERIGELSKQLTEAVQEIKDLSKQLGQEYARGIIEGLDKRRDDPR